ncbi:MAG: hypothetical protein JWO06_3802 [Bacteroidota bacterium]|nr:hypothetical protein [Bacteroidota bacterium]
MKRHFYILVGMLLLNSCNNNSQGKIGNSTTSASGGNGKYLKFKPAKVNDPSSTGQALTMLIPDGWNMQGKVIWTLDNSAYPATGQIQATDPSGQMEFEYFPLGCFFATRNQMTLISFPYGSKYMGCLVVSEVPSAAGAIKKYLLPLFRKNVTNLKVIEEKVLSPEKRQVIATNIYSRSETVLLRVEYTENGKAYEENIYGIRSVTDSPGTDFNNWTLSNCYGFKAPKGKLADNMKLFHTMLGSIQIDKKWYANYMAVSQVLTQQGYAAIKAAGERSRIIAKASDETNQMISDSYWKTQKANDQVFENYSDYQRGVDTYVDPSSNESYKLPTGYGNAWKNALGEYIVSDEPGFDPGKISNQNWTELQLKH